MRYLFKQIKKAKVAKGEVMQKLLIVGFLFLGACAKPQLEQVEQSTLNCQGPNYGFTATTTKELQAVEGFYYDKKQTNYFLVGMKPFVAFNVSGHEIVVERTGLYIDGEYAGDVKCEQY